MTQVNKTLNIYPYIFFVLINVLVAASESNIDLKSISNQTTHVLSHMTTLIASRKPMVSPFITVAEE